MISISPTENGILFHRFPQGKTVPIDSEIYKFILQKSSDNGNQKILLTENSEVIVYEKEEYDIRCHFVREDFEHGFHEFDNLHLVTLQQLKSSESAPSSTPLCIYIKINRRHGKLSFW